MTKTWRIMTQSKSPQDMMIMKMRPMPCLIMAGVNALFPRLKKKLPVLVYRLRGRRNAWTNGCFNVVRMISKSLNWSQKLKGECSIKSEDLRCRISNTQRSESSLGCDKSSWKSFTRFERCTVILITKQSGKIKTGHAFNERRQREKMLPLFHCSALFESFLQRALGLDAHRN